MPTQVGRNRVKATVARQLQVQTVWSNLPWGGMAPDLNDAMLDFSIAKNINGLVDKSGVLTADDGLQAIDEPNLPLNSGEPILMLAQMVRTEADGTVRDPAQHIIAITGPTGSGTASPMFYLNNLNEWENIPHSGAGTDDLANNASNASRDTLYDWCVLEDGAPSRGSHTTALSGDVDEPCMIFTNNYDPVQIYPVDPGGGYTSTGVYETLTDNVSYAPFLAKSVCAFDGRVLYFNVEEAGTRYRNRIRWSQVGSAEPSTEVGAGAMDLTQFQQDGLRLLRIGDRVVAYAQDGIAFLSRTFNPQQPFKLQYASNDRGLYGPRAVCQVSHDLHFGIFTDGWFLIDSSGQMVELGITESNGVKLSKWKKTFYTTVDVSLRERIVCHYDSTNGYIRITWPKIGDVSADNETVWIYDLQTDRLFSGEYNATMFSSGDLFIDPYITWNTATGTWEEATGFWRSQDPSFGLRRVLLGNKDGYVAAYHPAIYTQLGVVPAWGYQTGQVSAGASHLTKKLNKLFLHYADQGEQTLSWNAIGELSSSSGTIDYGAVEDNQPKTMPMGIQAAGTAVGFVLTGVQPVKILNIGAQLKFSHDENQPASD